jgi:hypothetical protein
MSIDGSATQLRPLAAQRIMKTQPIMYESARLQGPSQPLPAIRWLTALAAVWLIVQPIRAADFEVTFTRITEGEIVNTPGSTWGCAWGDYDGDGYPDLLAVNGFTDLGNYLYRNNREGTFSRILADNPIVLDQTDGGGGVWADYDNDGDLDLFVTTWAQPNAFYANQGSGVFARITEGRIATDEDSSVGCSWGDYDADGWLDLIVGNGMPDEVNALYHSRGDGTFERVLAGPIVEEVTSSQGVAWGDCNNDGRPDLFVTHPLTNDSLFINQGNGQFRKVTGAHPGTVVGLSAGCVWGDYDNDGWLDLFVATAAGEVDLLYHNTAHGGFERVTNEPMCLIADGTGGSAWGDYDNDGHLDLMVVGLNGYYLFRNQRDGTFEQVTSSPGNDVASGQSCAWADYDNDGFLDLFIGVLDDAFSDCDRLYHNDGNSNAWLHVRPVGTVSNRSAIGAKVRIRATIWGQPIWQMREIATGDGFTGQSDLRAHFGLGDATNVTTLRIEWPSGIVQELSNVAANQILTITEPAQLVPLGPREFQIRCWKGMKFEVEKSHNLQTWDSLGTVTNVIGTLTFQDTQGDPQAAGCFYRVVSR